MSECEIVTIVLVKNEDMFLERVLSNIFDFSDKIIIADNCSNDKTSAIALDFVETSAKYEYHKIKHPAISHDLVKGYAGDKVWIFGVDGDELYDHIGLKLLRKDILKGIYDSYWALFGNVLHCTSIDEKAKTATGYMSPPCRSMTKLYNFAHIESWDGDCPERLHGGTLVFRRGHGANARKYLYKEVTWNDALFRCLHVCFLPRSSLDKISQNITMRPNIADEMAKGKLTKLAGRFKRMITGEYPESSLKREKYMRGPLQQVSAKVFLDYVICGRSSEEKDFRLID